MINKERLKDARDNADLTQEEIANLLNISSSAYARYENENDTFPLKHLVSTCDILNIPLDYVFNFSTNNNYANLKHGYNIPLSCIRLRELRSDNNLTQLQLSNILKIDRSVISKYENGKVLIATPFLYQICKKYNISADYLLGKIDSPKYLK